MTAKSVGASYVSALPRQARSMHDKRIAQRLPVPGLMLSVWFGATPIADMVPPGRQGTVNWETPEGLVAYRVQGW